MKRTILFFRTEIWARAITVPIVTVAMLVGAAIIVPSARAATETLVATPSSASFASVPVGMSNSQTIQLKNTGTSNVTISSSSVSKAGFKLEGLTTPQVLGPGKTVNCTLVFAPTSTGSVAASASITSTAVNKTLTLTMSGTGVTATKVLLVSPTVLNFGNESVGSTRTITVDLKNIGNSPVTVYGTSVSAAEMSTNDGAKGATLEPEQTASLEISFSPSKAGSAGGMAVITSSATRSQTNLYLSGTGVSGSSASSSSTSSSSASHSVALTWDPSSSPNISGYIVYRAIGTNGGYSRLTTSPVNELRYTDDAVAAGETYKYTVTAVNSSGEESASSAAQTVAIP